MAQMVDSQQKELSAEDIIAIAAMNINEVSSRDQLIASINAELSMDDTLFIRQGNTLFVIHKAAPRVGWFRAFNADTAQNFLANCLDFSRACYKMGFDVMASTFRDPTILAVLRYIAKNPPFPEMGYKVQKTETGGFLATIKMGPKRGNK